MAKRIKMTDEQIESLLEEMRKQLSKAKFATGKMSVSKDLGVVDADAVLYFEKTAWEKMQALIEHFDKEVAWHGVTSRKIIDGVYVYTISDIVVYPQTVTGCTVEMDETEYAKWLTENIQDERFNNLHMQGHSHVNMGTTPSSTDLKHQEDILSTIGRNGYQIFVIWNKKNDHTCKIYDLAANILFEDSDIDVMYEGEEEINKFIEEARGLVKSKNDVVKSTKSTTAKPSDYYKYGVYSDNFDYDFYDDYDYGYFAKAKHKAARCFNQ